MKIENIIKIVVLNAVVVVTTLLAFNFEAGAAGSCINAQSTLECGFVYANQDICAGDDKPVAGSVNNESGTHIDAGLCGLVYDARTFDPTGDSCGYSFAELDSGECPDDDDDDDDDEV